MMVMKKAPQFLKLIQRIRLTYQLALSDCLQFNYLMDFLPDKSRQLSRLAPWESVARNLAESGGRGLAGCSKQKRVPEAAAAGKETVPKF